MAKKCPICDLTWDDTYTNCPMDDAALTSIRKVIPNPSSQQDSTAGGGSQGHARYTPYSSPQTNTGNSQPYSGSGMKAAKSPKSVYVEGVVRNFHEDIIHTNPVKQWFLALRKGCPYVRDGSINTFDLVESNGDIHSVILFGRIIRGRFQDHSSLRVFGSPDRSNTIIAKQIHNLGSNSTVEIHKSLPNTAVWVMTGLMLMVLVYLVFFVDYIHLLQTGASAVTGFVLSVVSAVLPLIIVVFAGWYMIRRIFR